MEPDLFSSVNTKQEPASVIINDEAENKNLNSNKQKLEINLKKVGIKVHDIKLEVERHLQAFEPIKHKEILTRLLKQIHKIDFREKVEFTDDKQKLSKKHFLVCSIENILDCAHINNWGICKNHDFVYVYNSAYWNLLDNAELQTFLGKAAEEMGIDKFDARFYTFRDQLFKQFLAVANLPKPEKSDDVVFVNLKNGTFEISSKKQKLRPPKREDFLTYQLPFEYNQNALAPLFENYLNTVLPDINMQKILAEYLGSLFIKQSTLKLEKALLLYGGGANGKSVFFDIVNALLGGTENVSSYSLQNS